jgi:hypothetical protein
MLRQDGDIELHKVTHQGCPDASADASLLECDTPSAAQATAATEPALVAISAALVCRRCAHRLRPHVRQRYLQLGGVRWRNPHDHPT